MDAQLGLRKDGWTTTPFDPDAGAAIFVPLAPSGRLVACLPRTLQFGIQCIERLLDRIDESDAQRIGQPYKLRSALWAQPDRHGLGPASVERGLAVSNGASRLHSMPTITASAPSPCRCRPTLEKRVLRAGPISISGDGSSLRSLHQPW
jgi:hypothetical protein